MTRFNFGSGVNSTSGSTSYPNNHVYSDYGAGFPSGNADSGGTRRVKIYSVGADYAAGASGISSKISIGGTPTTGGTTYSNPGGGFRFEIHYSSGTLSFGRNTGNGVTTRDNADGYSWTGGLCGWFEWATVPTAPQAFAVSTSGLTASFSATGSASTGGQTITSYSREMSIDGGSWGNARTDWGTAYTMTPGKTYRWRLRAINDVGGSGYTYTQTITAPTVPTAPSSISLVRTARSVTVTLGASSSTGGSTITGYYVQHSADGGATWSALVQTAADRTYTYANLDAGKTYRFRAVARNVVGDSAAVTSADLFVPAGGRRWDTASGTWIPTSIARRWDAASGAWVDLTIARRWDAATSSWKDLT